MDDNFFKKLDEALTNVGADRYWERTVGGHVVWFSSVPFKSQHKINDMMSNPALGNNIIGEVKRMTMSYSIVGFDGFDLRQYRNEVPSFPYYDKREKCQVNVTLNKYLHSKMEEWGIEWVDSAFEVFADIMETLKKENIKEVKFDNARTRREELAELEEKAYEIRVELGLPHMAEIKPDGTQEVKEKVEEKTEEPVVLFDPFRRIPGLDQEPSPVVNLPKPAEMNATPVKPAFVDDVLASVTPPTRGDGTIERPHVSRPSDDIIDVRPPKTIQPAIEIDPVRANTNPRFNRG